LVQKVQRDILVSTKRTKLLVTWHISLPQNIPTCLCGTHWKKSLQSSPDLLTAVDGHCLAERGGRKRKKEGREGKGKLRGEGRKGCEPKKGWAGSAVPEMPLPLGMVVWLRALEVPDDNCAL